MLDHGTGRESHGTRTSDSDCGDDTTGGNSVCGRATERSWGNQIPLCLTSNSKALPHGESSEPPEVLRSSTSNFDDPCDSGG